MIYSKLSLNFLPLWSRFSEFWAYSLKSRLRLNHVPVHKTHSAMVRNIITTSKTPPLTRIETVRVRECLLDVVVICMTLALCIMCTGTWFNWRRLLDVDVICMTLALCIVCTGTWLNWRRLLDVVDICMTLALCIMCTGTCLNWRRLLDVVDICMTSALYIVCTGSDLSVCTGT